MLHISVQTQRDILRRIYFYDFRTSGSSTCHVPLCETGEEKAAGGLLLSAALACMATGITEPLEFSFLFVAPALFVVQVILAGTAI